MTLPFYICLRENNLHLLKIPSGFWLISHGELYSTGRTHQINEIPHHLDNSLYKLRRESRKTCNLYTENCAVMHTFLCIPKLALADFDRYKASAKRAARIDDGTKHELFSNLPEFPPKL